MAIPIVSMEQLAILAITFFIPPIFGLVILIIILATVGKSLGIRKAYVSTLLQVFSWASRRIERANRSNVPVESSEESEADELDHRKPASIDRPSSPTVKNVIQKDATMRIMRSISVAEPEKSQAILFIGDSLEFVKAGVEAIIDDEVTSRFSAEELRSWNLLSRTSLGYQYVSLRLTILWCLGFLLRYFVLFPIRLVILAIGLVFLIVATAFVGYVPEGQLKRRLNRHVSLICYRILCRAVTAIITYHNRENMARPGGICVANHTSPIDVMILSCDNCYALVGQKHGGLLGVIQRALNRASSHIWFERSEVNDRTAVSRRLREHVEDSNKLPILIFPEGTCINNTSVMMFKKGSFEVGGVIYPAAIKYDARFGDAFWNSSSQSYIQYLIMMMTSWAIVVNVRYLPPMTRQEGESAVDFAARVKKAIAAAGGLVELDWDGQLKRYPVKKEMLEKQQERYSRRIKSSGVHLHQMASEVGSSAISESNEVPPAVDNLVPAAQSSHSSEITEPDQIVQNGHSVDDGETLNRSDGIIAANGANVDELLNHSDAFVGDGDNRSPHLESSQQSPAIKAGQQSPPTKAGQQSPSREAGALSPACAIDRQSPSFDIDQQSPTFTVDHHSPTYENGHPHLLNGTGLVRRHVNQPVTNGIENHGDE